MHCKVVSIEECTNRCFVGCCASTSRLRWALRKTRPVRNRRVVLTVDRHDFPAVECNVPNYLYRLFHCDTRASIATIFDLFEIQFQQWHRPGTFDLCVFVCVLPNRCTQFSKMEFFYCLPKTLCLKHKTRPMPCDYQWTGDESLCHNII